jgi:Lrp/AsnC family leucine-responsive transcriptional regulator
MLQHNEKRVLQRLAKNARTSDSAIAKEIGISTQAVGKIRRKLEHEEVIKEYHLRLDHNAVGLGIVSVAMVQLPPAIIENEDAFRAQIIAEPHVIDCYRLMHGNAHLLMVFAFSDLGEKEQYVKAFLHKYPSINIISMQTNTWDIVWKNTKKDAYILHLSDAKHPQPFNKKRDDRIKRPRG